MRKSKTIKIDDKEIVVKELRVKDVLDIFDAIGQEGIGDLSNQIEIFLPKITSGLSVEDLKNMAPSEIMQVVNVAKEVNSDFLSLARQLGLDKIMKEFKEAAVKDFSGLLAGSLERGMSASLNTDIQHFPSQQMNTEKQEMSEYGI